MKTFASRNYSQRRQTASNKTKAMKNIFVIITGLLSVVYLINPTAGIFEIIPDSFPIIGNLDEAAACALFIAVLRYFGIDLTGFLRSVLDSRNQKK